VERDADDVSVDVDRGTDTVNVPAPPTDTSTPPAGAGGGGVYVARGVCPFECCTYRDWTLETTATVRAEPSADASVIANLAVGTVIRADSGNVYVTQPGLVVADQPFPVEETPNAPMVAAGDTLYLLDNMGEGFVHTRYRGRIYETSGAAWFGGGPPGSTTAGRLIRETVSQWWAHVTLADGRAGWVLMDDVRVDGADACA
jgi:hypothetical protein